MSHRPKSLRRCAGGLSRNVELNLPAPFFFPSPTVSRPPHMWFECQLGYIHGGSSGIDLHAAGPSYRESRSQASEWVEGDLASNEQRPPEVSVVSSSGLARAETSSA